MYERSASLFKRLDNLGSGSIGYNVSDFAFRCISKLISSWDCVFSMETESCVPECCVCVCVCVCVRDNSNVSRRTYPKAPESLTFSCDDLFFDFDGEDVDFGEGSLFRGGSGGGTGTTSGEKIADTIGVGGSIVDGVSHLQESTAY